MVFNVVDNSRVTVVFTHGSSAFCALLRKNNSYPRIVNTPYYGKMICQKMEIQRMDLRPYVKNYNQVVRGVELIKNGSLFYQPFIIDENLEVGEGQNFADRYKDVKHVHDLNVYAQGFDVGMRKLAPDKDYFRHCNAEYRALYDFITDSVIKLTPEKIEELTVAEIGCNTGLSLFNFAKRGAKACVGFDWNDMNPVFHWLNEILGIRVEFQRGTWNNLQHVFNEGDVPEVDIMINTIFTNHQCDPMQFITYLCDRARKGVFLWLLVNEMDTPAIFYPTEPPHEILNTHQPFPLYFNNGVVITTGLLNIIFKRLGFGKVTELKPVTANSKLEYFTQSFRMYYAQRTQDIKSAYWRK